MPRSIRSRTISPARRGNSERRSAYSSGSRRWRARHRYACLCPSAVHGGPGCRRRLLHTLAPNGAGPEPIPRASRNLAPRTTGFTPADATRRLSLPFEVRDAGGPSARWTSCAAKPYCSLSGAWIVLTVSSGSLLSNNWRRSIAIGVWPCCRSVPMKTESRPKSLDLYERRHVQNLAVFADPSALSSAATTFRCCRRTRPHRQPMPVAGAGREQIDWSTPAVADLLNAISRRGRRSIAAEHAPCRPRSIRLSGRRPR